MLKSMTHPFLNRLEVLLIRLLLRSPNIGFIMVKHRGSNVSWVLHDISDPMPGDPYEGAETAPPYADQLHGEPACEEDSEPLSMQFERLYHLPDAER
jgi:hypothetical protein